MTTTTAPTAKEPITEPLETSQVRLQRAIDAGLHITYALQRRKCGKKTCSTCRDGQGHGPYWYAYHHESIDNENGQKQSKLCSAYIGKVKP